MRPATSARWPPCSDNPTLVEPRLGLHAQGRGWTLGYVLLLALVAATARVVWKAGADGKERMGAAEAEPPAVSPSPSAGARLRCVAYSFVPASLMMVARRGRALAGRSGPAGRPGPDYFTFSEIVYPTSDEDLMDDGGRAGGGTRSGGTGPPRWRGRVPRAQRPRAGIIISSNPEAAPSADQVKNQGAASAPRWMVEKYATLVPPASLRLRQGGTPGRWRLSRKCNSCRGPRRGGSRWAPAV
jgi:hypothetical protein